MYKEREIKQISVQNRYFRSQPQINFFYGKQEEVNGGSQNYFEKLWKTVINDPIFETMKKLDTTNFRTEASP